jgi:hypothetical protein
VIRGHADQEADTAVAFGEQITGRPEPAGRTMTSTTGEPCTSTANRPVTPVLEDKLARSEETLRRICQKEAAAERDVQIELHGGRASEAGGSSGAAGRPQQGADLAQSRAAAQV